MTDIVEHLKAAVPGFDQPRTPQPGDSVMSILCSRGDYKLTYNPDKDEEVAMARKTFDELKRKGYTAFRVDPDSRGEKGEQLREFDPRAGQMIMSPRMQGG